MGPSDRDGEGDQGAPATSGDDEEGEQLSLGYTSVISPELIYVLKTFDPLPNGPNIDELWNLRNLRGCDSLIDPFSEEDLFQLQIALCESMPMGVSMHMSWSEAGQLPLSDAIRIIETMARKNDELARAMKKRK